MPRHTFSCAEARACEECHSRELFDVQAAFGTTKAAQAFVLSVSTAFVAVLLIYWSGAATQKTGMQDCCSKRKLTRADRLEHLVSHS